MIIVSDIHWRLRYKEEDRPLREELTESIIDDGILILCGDVAHRATPAQYALFKEWLEDLREQHVTLIVTPGNHDITRGEWKFKWMNRSGIRRFHEIMDIASSNRIAYRNMDAVYKIGNDVFVCLNTTKPFMEYNRINKLQMVWTHAVVPDVLRRHLVTHHSLWTKPDDRHLNMAKAERLVYGLLEPLRFDTAINGHNHRFEYNPNEEVAGYHIKHVQTPAATGRKTRGNPGPGYVRWSTLDGAEMVKLDG